MASVIDKFKKKNTVVKQSSVTSEWSKTGSFMHKPDRGWIHPDNQLMPDAGICYGVRYIGCQEVKESMRALDFDTRTALAREAINRVSEAAGLKTATKRKKVEKKILKMLGDRPQMQHAGSNVNLTITTESLNLMIMESGEIIANHQMPGISFASGGDSETLDFVAYVAKDTVYGRACHVLECGGGLSEDVITTVGQAFELRFKEYLKSRPHAVEVPNRMEVAISDGDAWGDDHEGDYYNDRPNARPPSPAPLPHPLTAMSNYETPPSNLPVGLYASVKEHSVPPLYDMAKDECLIDLNEDRNVYDNSAKSEQGDRLNVYDNKENVLDPPTLNGTLDPFDMEPFSAELPEARKPTKNGFPEPAPRLSKQRSGAESPSNPVPPPRRRSTMAAKDPSAEVTGAAPTVDGSIPPVEPLKEALDPAQMMNQRRSVAPVFEEWFHGALSRKDAEKLLLQDGDFLVRQSSNDKGQFVLSGRQNGHIKHLLLIDPEGVVRTKDHTFESVPHLITYHRSKGIPIVSQDSELHLIRSISNNYTNC